MKRAFAILGLGLLIVPLLQNLTVERRLNAAKSLGEFASTLMSISSGFTIAFVGVMILGILIDGGSGYRKPYILILMAIIGGLWIAFYPHGWFLGVPLILYSLLHRFGFGAAREKRNRHRNSKTAQ